MVAPAGQLAVVNKVDGVSGSGILRNILGIKIRPARVGIDDDVFQDATETEGLPNLRLALPREANGLGVAAPLDIEDPSLGPGGLLIAGETAYRNGAPRRLPGARESEG